MSLLSALLDDIPAPEPAARYSVPQTTAVISPHLTTVFRALQRSALLNSANTNAVTATPEWRQARDRYINHIMVCRSCYAPNSRYCAAGAALRATYDLTPMEAQR